MITVARRPTRARSAGGSKRVGEVVGPLAANSFSAASRSGCSVIAAAAFLPG